MAKRDPNAGAPKPLDVNELIRILQEHGYDVAPSAAAAGVDAIQPTGSREDPELLRRWAEQATAAANVQAAKSAAGIAGAGTLPRRVDCRNFTYGGVTGNWTTEPKEQGQCGSCVAFAFCGVLESRMKITCKMPSMEVNLSEADIWSRANGACSGFNMGTSSEAMKGIVNQGVGAEINFGYTGIKNDPPQPPIPVIVRTSRYIDLYTREAKKDCLVNRGPFITNIQTSPGFQAHRSTSRVFRRAVNDPLEPLHCVMIAGYDDDLEGGAWLIKNSWLRWGMNGWGYLGYGELGSDNFPGFDPSIVMTNACPGPVEPPPPTCDLDKITLSAMIYAARRDLVFRACLKYHLFQIGMAPNCTADHMRRVNVAQLIFARCSHLNLKTTFRTNLLSLV